MNTTKKLTKHLDKIILRFFIAVFLLSTPVFAYRYVKNKSCEEVVFTSDADSYRQGELIKFTDGTEQAKSWKWDFGDSTAISTVRNPLHVFKNSGEFLVKLTVNDFCEHTQVITIDEKLFLKDPKKFPVFNIPESVTVGETLVIQDLTENASVWEWRFGETAEANSKKRTAEYVYKTPGLKTISLIVNGDIDHMSKKQINVLPIIEDTNDNLNEITGTNRRLGDGLPVRPPSHRTETPDDNTAPIAAPYISDDNFSNKLLLVAKDQISASAFNEYFCGNLSANVIANGKTMSFLEFCEGIAKKNLKIRKLEIHRNEGTNCIKNVTIRHRKFFPI